MAHRGWSGSVPNEQTVVELAAAAGVLADDRLGADLAVVGSAAVELAVVGSVE